MILENALPRIKEAIEKADKTGEKPEVTFIYQELLNYDTVFSLFEWLFRNGTDFTTRHDEYRFVIIIHPKKK